MKTLSLLMCAALLGVAAAQFNFFRPQRPRNRPQQQFRPRPQFRRPPQQQFQQRPQQQFQSQAAPQGSNSGLYYSWRDPEVGRNRKFTWGEANAACKGRGQSLVSLDSPGKNSQVVGDIARDNIKYIWTGGRRSGNGFTWANDKPVQPFNWGQTGGIRRPQPDNREGDENCLAILNRFYPGDGITWHDVSCHHKKPYVCE